MTKQEYAYQILLKIRSKNEKEAEIQKLNQEIIDLNNKVIELEKESK